MARIINGIKCFIGFLRALIKNKLKKKDSIYYRPGTHYITGYVGSGKTLLMNKLIQGLKPDECILSNINEFYGQYFFSMEDYFKNGQQVLRFPKVIDNKKVVAIIFDEVNLSFNRRLNRSNSYNELFIGLIEFLVSYRHQGFKTVYLIGQKLELQDTQLQSLFQYQHHIIKNKKVASFYFYKKNGNIIYRPKKLYIMNKIKKENEDLSIINIDKLKISISELESYNTKGFAIKYIKLNKGFYKSSSKKD